ncbi:NeuD/PglB/VioB family sugar acetyltransferase [Lapillicoccus jejuensis]|uniref:Sugar O-acyltransferase (Sialic acid O-acetyltransferase NeuD family) n=1 Tax=Lapillicoccus jejuensis TaxID=402171 RepID=A0A542E1G0_9MICO|nr:NeuD/PglB/VioB family sugar acetyltransferase [Lapillicoccus jejuensis]TQJ09155.1 sugar O-acyltransferase (sialic acid O-acetyltransferase NeuD family) [Lapillicoccus jejuensis]
MSEDDRPLLLVAAGGLARESAEAARAAGRTVLGFLDDDPRRRRTEPLPGLTVLGGLDVALEHPDAALVLCPGKGRVRLALAQRLAGMGVGRDRYGVVLDPSVRVPASARVGVGAVLLAGTVLTADVEVGDHVVAMPHVVLTHGDVVEDGATLCAGVVLGGDVRVASGAYVGMAASVRERVTVGEDAVVGMGAVVVTDVPAGETWAGVPARRLER